MTVDQAYKELEQLAKRRAALRKYITVHTPGGYKPKRKSDIPAFEVISKVSEVTGVSKKLIMGKRRLREVVNARYMVAYILHDEFNWSLTDTGKALGRDHSLMYHAVKQISDTLSLNKRHGVDQKLVDKLHQAINELKE